jgi:hypothetical protein
MPPTNDEIRMIVRDEFDTIKDKIMDEVKEHSYTVAIAVMRQSKTHETAPETNKRLLALEQANERLNRAIFGDKDTNIGMLKKVDEMYTAIIEVRGIKGFFKNILLISGVVGVMYAFFRRF